MKTHIVYLLALTMVLLTGVALAAGSISIDSVSIPSSVNQGDTFTITASVTGSQASNVAGTLTLPTGITCTPTGSQTISLSNSGTGTASWSCTANATGDYTNQITASVTATDSGTGGSLSASTQTGLTVLTPASLTVTSSMSSSSFTSGATDLLTIGINNAGSTSTNYTLSVTNSPSTITLGSPVSGSTTGTITGNSVVNVQYNVTGTTAATYTLTATVVGGNGQNLTTSQSVTVNAASSSSNTSSSGGGGGVAANTTTTTSNGTAQISIFVLSAGDRIIDLGLKSNDTSVRRLEFNTTDVTSNVQIVVDKSTSLPSWVSTSPPTGSVFNYIVINLTNLTDSLISGAFVDFSVNNSWLSANSIDKNSVALYRFSSGAWTKLSTSISKEETDNIVYRASSPGLSVFAIEGQAAPSQPPPPSGGQTNQTGGTNSNGTNTTTGIPPPPPIKLPSLDTNMLEIGAGVIIILVLIAGYYVMKRGSKKSKYEYQKK